MNRPEPTLGNPKNTIEILQKYKFVKREFFRIMFIQIGTDFLKFREDTVGRSVSIFFFLPEKKLGGKAVQQFVFQQLPVAAAGFFQCQKLF